MVRKLDKRFKMNLEKVQNKMGPFEKMKDVKGYKWGYSISVWCILVRSPILKNKICPCPILPRFWFGFESELHVNICIYTCNMFHVFEFGWIGAIRNYTGDRPPYPFLIQYQGRTNGRGGLSKLIFNLHTIPFFDIFLPFRVYNC